MLYTEAAFHQPFLKPFQFNFNIQRVVIYVNLSTYYKNVKQYIYVKLYTLCHIEFKYKNGQVTRFDYIKTDSFEFLPVRKCGMCVCVYVSIYIYLYSLIIIGTTKTTIFNLPTVTQLFYGQLRTKWEGNNGLTSFEISL